MLLGYGQQIKTTVLKSLVESLATDITNNKVSRNLHGNKSQRIKRHDGGNGRVKMTAERRGSDHLKVTKYTTFKKVSDSMSVESELWSRNYS